MFAVSVSHEPSATAPAAPLYDTLADHQPGGVPLIPQTGQTFTDATQITLLPPLYHEPNSFHYTIDGSEPTAASPIYQGPFFALDTVSIAAREIDANGYTSPVVHGVVNIHDNTPPRLVSVLTNTPDTLNLGFSAPLNPTVASDIGNYTIQPQAAVKKITPTPDGLGVTLTFAAPLSPVTAYTISVHGIKDASPAGNLIQPITKPFSAQNVVYTLASAELPGGAVTTSVSGLPVLKTDNWTVNLLVKTDAKPNGRVIIAGFGQREGEQGSGMDARYFAVFRDGITFWYAGHGHDVASKSPLDLGRWQMLTATYNGNSISLYKDGEPIAQTRVGLKADSQNIVSVGGPDPWEHKNTFQGSIKDFTIRRGALTDREVRRFFEETKPVQ